MVGKAQKLHGARFDTDYFVVEGKQKIKKSVSVK
jgi:hypothetical protein